VLQQEMHGRSLCQLPHGWPTLWRRVLPGPRVQPRYVPGLQAARGILHWVRRLLLRELQCWHLRVHM
jgi:hypothetical protein